MTVDELIHELRKFSMAGCGTLVAFTIEGPIDDILVDEDENEQLRLWVR